MNQMVHYMAIKMTNQMIHNFSYKKDHMNYNGHAKNLSKMMDDLFYACPNMIFFYYIFQSKKLCFSTSVKNINL
jgi:hypothetical protein